MEELDLFDEIIFNDAEGTDRELYPYETLGIHDYSSNNHWDEPKFYTSGNDWCNSITYDCIKEDVRYTAIIEMTVTNEKYVSIHYGKAYRDAFYDNKKITLIGNQYGMDYFVNYVGDKLEVESSKKKFIKLMKQLTSLKVFL